MSTNPPGPEASKVPRDPATSTESNANDNPSIGQLFAALSAQLTFLFRGEIELTKKKAAAFFLRFAKGAAALIVVAVLSLYLLAWVLRTIEIAFSYLVPDWAASLIIVVVLLLLIVILTIIGVGQLKKAFGQPPAPQEGIKDDLDAIKKGLGK